MSDATSRIVTAPMLDQDTPSFRVSSIAWDSSFRATGLRPGDRIIALNGKAIARPATLQEMQRTLPSSIGQYQEGQFWAAAGRREGDAVTLTVLRRNFPGQGWQTLQFTGALLPERVYSTAEGRRALAPGGPDWMENDGFSDGWGFWYEKVVQKFTWLQDGAWQQASLNSRFELQQHMQLKPQVDFLSEHYPGAFSQAVAEDWQTICDSLNGRQVQMTDASLKYRRAEDEKVQEARDAGAAAFEAFRQKISEQTIDPFPAPNPVQGDWRAAAGKYVVLPQIGNRDWLDQGGRTFFAFGDPSSGYYFAEAERPDAQAMLLAAARYRKLVSPSLYESYTVIGRITDEPTLKVISGQGFYGLEIEIAAALVGDAMFVDVTQRKEDFAPFAAEELFNQPMHSLPPDDATPRDVMDAFIDSIKMGDLKLWSALFADWRVVIFPEGPVIYPHDTIVDESYWESSRRTMTTRAYDVQVAWTGDPRAVTSGKEFAGAPLVEEVDVEVDHVGLFDGEYRVFKDVTVNRLWQMQRYNGGPWRITSMQSI